MQKLCALLFMFGFKQSVRDYSLFIIKFKDSITILLVFLDGIILTGSLETELKKVKYENLISNKISWCS